MLEMMIDSIRVSLMNYQRVVILKEKTRTGTFRYGLVRLRRTPSLSSFRTSQYLGPLPTTC